MPTLRQRLYQMFYASDPADPVTLIDNYLVPGLIAIDVAALILESFEDLAQGGAIAFRTTEIIIITAFTLEYLLRLWVCVEDPAYAQPLRGRLRYGCTVFALLDLAAFLPFYLLNLLPVGWATLLGPFFRLLRLFKLIRYSESTQIFVRVLRDKRDELLTTLFVVMTLLVIASSLMYFIERDAQPQDFASIPAAMWWGVITLTTVGYGDVHPITPLGKFLSAILAFLGIGIFALPARDIATAFSAEMALRSQKRPSNLPPLMQQVEASADLMGLCVEVAKRKLGAQFKDEAMVRDLAIALFQETSKSLNPPSSSSNAESCPFSLEQNTLEQNTLE